MLTAEERGCTQTSWMGRGLWKNVSIHSFIAQCPLKSIERFGGARGYTWQLSVCYSTPCCVDLGIIRVCYVTSQGFHVTAVSTLIQSKSLDVRYYTVPCLRSGYYNCIADCAGRELLCSAASDGRIPTLGLACPLSHTSRTFRSLHCSSVD